MAKLVIELRLKTRHLSLVEIDEHLDHVSREDGRPAPAIGLSRWRKSLKVMGVVNGTAEERLPQRLSHMWWSQVPEHVPCLICKSFVFQTWGLLSQASKQNSPCQTRLGVSPPLRP